MTKRERQVASSRRFGVPVTLDIRHEYFNGDGGMCRALRMTPARETRRRLESVGAQARLRDDGFDLIVADNLGSTLALSSAWDDPDAYAARARIPAHVRRALLETPLRFEMTLRDPLFADFTDMPADLPPGDPPLCFSNLDARRVGERDGVITLDCDEVANLSTIQPDDRASPASAGAGVDPRRGHAKVDLPADGRSGDQCGSTTFGMFELHLVPPEALASEAGASSDDTMGAGGGLSKSGASAPMAYELRFAARRTFWRYIVAARNGQLPGDALDIVDASPTIDPTSLRRSFARSTETCRLPDGRDGVVFTSDTALPLRQRPEPLFALRGLPRGGHVRSRTLVDSLPAPSPRCTVFDDAGPPTASASIDRSRVGRSDIYVFV